MKSQTRARNSTGLSTLLKARPTKTKRSAKTTPADSSPRGGSSGSAPEWALEGIFREARVMAWEGKPATVSATAIYPPDAATFKSLPTASPANWHRCIHPLDRARTQQHFANLKATNLP